MTAFLGLFDAAFCGSPLAEQVGRSARHRSALAEVTDAYRLNDENGDELESVVIERFGDWAVLSTYSERAAARAEAIASALLELGARGVYVKSRVRTDLRRVEQQSLARSQPLVGEASPDEVVVTECGRRYLVRLGDGLSTGLFVDQRDNRSMLQAGTRGARVLNLFAYTCAFSIAAGLGGAEQVTSVDLSGAVLRRGAENIRLNDLDPGRHRLLKADAVKWLERAVRRGDQYDWVVLDPPSFSSMGKESFSVASQYGRVATSALRLVAPGGAMLCVTNHRKTSPKGFEGLLRDAAKGAGRTLTSVELRSSPSDCRPDESGSYSTKSVLLRVR